MPWKLENNSKQTTKYFLPNKLYTIGRAYADFIVNDKSISRKHASITWDSNLNYLNVDDFSKFGTFINKVAMNNKNGLLKNGDTITFGAQPGVDFKCSFIPFNIVSSNLYLEDKLLLKQILSSCGGRVIDNWNENIDYLVMSNLKVTFKVVCALIKQVIIVKIDFIKEMIAYFKGEITILPNPKNYLPEIGSPDENFPSVMFESNLKRQSLFNNKTFYFMSPEKFSRLSEAITFGGGHIFLLTEENCNSDIKMKLVQSNSIVMNETITTNLVKMVLNILKSAGRRTIIDSEIGFAVLHISIDDYCNPSKPNNRLEKLENDAPRISSPTSSVKTIKQTKLDNLFVPVKRKSKNSPENYQENSKRMKTTEIFQIEEENEVFIDLDQIPSPKIHVDDLSKNNSLKPKLKKPRHNEENENSVDLDRIPKNNFLKSKMKNCVKGDNKNVSKIFFQPNKASNQEKNIRLFSEIKNNQEDSDDEFDKISVPGFVDPLSSSNNKIISDKPKSISASSFKTSENVSKILQQSKSCNENSKNETIISKSNERMIHELFRNQAVVSVPVELRNIQSEVSEYMECVDDNVKFIKLVKEKYVKCENFKTFQKKSIIYIEKNPEKLVLSRK